MQDQSKISKYNAVSELTVPAVEIPVALLQSQKEMRLETVLQFNEYLVSTTVNILTLYLKDV